MPSGNSMVGAEAFDGKEESMETLEFSTVGINISRRSEIWVMPQQRLFWCRK